MGSRLKLYTLCWFIWHKRACGCILALQSHLWLERMGSMPLSVDCRHTSSSLLFTCILLFHPVRASIPQAFGTNITVSQQFKTKFQYKFKANFFFFGGATLQPHHLLAIVAVQTPVLVKAGAAEAGWDPWRTPHLVAAWAQINTH